MKIKFISIARLFIPLTKPFITAIRQTTHVDDIIVIMKTDCGKTGYGSAAATPAITGETAESIIAAIQQIIAPQLINRDISELNRLLQLNQNSIENNTSAKAAIDIALHDLFAQKCGLPLYQLLGGCQNKLDSCITISMKNVDDMVIDAKAFVADGFHKIKIKAGSSPSEDILRVTTIRQAVGDKITLFVDANQGWDCKEAINVIQTFEQRQLNICLIEQPVKAQSMSHLKYVRSQCKTPIIADESCFSPMDALNIATHQICDGINIKLMKCGGIQNANVIYNIAKTAHMQLMVGCMLESPIGVAAVASFALSKPDIRYADLDPIMLIRENYVKGGARLVGNEIVLSNQPGLGIEGFKQGLTPLCEVKNAL